MAHETRTPFNSGTDDAPQPKHSTKQEFGRRLYRLTLRKGWTQSELARRADIARDSISTYVRGITLPGPLNLQKLADALDVAPNDLLPEAADGDSDHDNDVPSLELKVSKNPNVSWLRVNRAVSTSTAVKVVEMINSDAPLDHDL